MITPVNRFFDQWLTLMERAFANLNPEEFYELEQKITKEIRSARVHRLKNPKTIHLHPATYKTRQRVREGFEIDG